MNQLKRITKMLSNSRSYAIYNVRFLVPRDMTSISSGGVYQIYKNVGDSVKSGEDVMELETAKGVIVEKSPVDGVIKEIFVKKEQEVVHKEFIFSVKN